MDISSTLSSDGKILCIEAATTLNYTIADDIKQIYSKLPVSCETVEVDMRKTQYIDSSGLGILLLMHKSLSHQVNEFVLSHCQQQVTKILNASQFHKYFHIK